MTYDQTLYMNLIKSPSGGQEFVYLANKSRPFTDEELKFDLDNMNKTDKNAKSVHEKMKEV